MTLDIIKCGLEYQSCFPKMWTILILVHISECHIASDKVVWDWKFQQHFYLIPILSNQVLVSTEFIICTVNNDIVGRGPEILALYCVCQEMSLWPSVSELTSLDSQSLILITALNDLQYSSYSKPGVLLQSSYSGRFTKTVCICLVLCSGKSWLLRI